MPKIAAAPLDLPPAVDLVRTSAPAQNDPSAVFECSSQLPSRCCDDHLNPPDQALVSVMRSNPEGSIGDWSQTIHKSRTSTVSALHRLRDAGLAESAKGKWRLAEEPAPREPLAKWIEPLSAAREQRAHA